MKSGVYEIRNTIIDRCYVGLAEDIEQRWEVHRRSLNQNDHFSTALQYDWNIQGEANFEFNVLEFCPIQKLVQREQYWFKKLDCIRNGYNTNPTSGMLLHIKRGHHEPSVGASDDWYTPPEIFQALRLSFDLDPCSPGPSHWVPAKTVFTVEDDGLAQPWHGLVFMNPPFGGRNGHTPWLEKFLNHGCGIAIVRAYTSSGWWHRYIPKAEALLFPQGKTKFIRPDGVIGAAPGHGIVLVGMGDVSITAMQNSGLGMMWDRRALIGSA